MAVVTPPSFLQYGAHSAGSDRMTVGALLQPGGTPMTTRGGVRPSGDGNSLKVTAQATPTNSVQVAAGTVFIPESDASGIYVCHNDAPVTLSIANASTTQNRRDLVIMEVLDQEVSGSSNLARLRVVTGTSTSGTATAPATPANSYALGEVSVPAGSTTNIANSAITDRRSVAIAIGGVLPATSTVMPSNPYPGMAVYCTDIDEMRVWNSASSSWRGQSFYPLPAPVAAGPAASIQNVTSTTWANLPTRHYIDFTAPRAMYVMLHLGAWISAVNGGDPRASISLSGATSGPGVNGLVISGSNWGGEALWVRNDNYAQTSMTLPWLLNAGTTRVEVQAYRNDTTGTPAVNYAVLRVTPLRFA